MTTGPYSTDLLARAADIPYATPLAEADGRARKRSMVCGSEVEVSVRLGEEARIAALGLDVRACALGQASASVFAHAAIGASLEEVLAGRDALTAMLKQGAPAPSGRFADLAALAGIRDFPRRHASTLLVWNAAADAMGAALTARDGG